MLSVIPMPKRQAERAVLSSVKGQAAAPLVFPRHGIEPPELDLEETLPLMGFPVRIRTNQQEVLSQIREGWRGAFPSRFVPPLQFDVHVLEDEGSLLCPPQPTYKLIKPLLMAVADSANFSVLDLSTLHTQVCLSSAALRYPLYTTYFFLQAPLSCIATRYTTPVHAACVSLGGEGMLLCGDSGVGKSTLAYACARAGWVFTSDDAAFILHGESGLHVLGNCYQFRFRPSAASLFPEIRGRAVTPRAAGKPSIEVPAVELPDIAVSPTARIRCVVFLDRRSGAAPELTPQPRAAARRELREVLYGLPETMAVQYTMLERLLDLPTLRLRYDSLEGAIVELTKLVMRSAG